jgi:hypothetical protein
MRFEGNREVTLSERTRRHALESTNVPSELVS